MTKYVSRLTQMEWCLLPCIQVGETWGSNVALQMKFLVISEFLSNVCHALMEWPDEESRWNT